jgi:Zn-dependent protease
MLGWLIKLFRWTRDGLFAALRFLLGWSLPLFRIRGIQLSLHSSFLLLMAYFAWTGWAEDDGRWRGLGVNVALLLAFFTCVVLHELGHALTGRRFGVDVTRILLMPIGGMAEFTSIPRRPRHEILMTLAGPAVNFAIAGTLWLAVGRPSPGALLRVLDKPIIAINGVEFVGILIISNLLMGSFNLLPVFPMDGGRILRATLATRLPYVRATRWAANAGRALAGLASLASLGFALYWAHQGEDEMELAPLYLRSALFAFIFMAAGLEYRMVRQMEIEDEHWRKTFIRLHQMRSADREDWPQKGAEVAKK